MPKNINCIAIIITLEGIEKIKLKKIITKESEEYFLHQCCRETAKTVVMASRFDWLPTSYYYLILTFHRSVFSRLKCILARKMRYNARQSDNKYCLNKRNVYHSVQGLNLTQFWINLNYVFQMYDCGFLDFLG